MSTLVGSFILTLIITLTSSGFKQAITDIAVSLVTMPLVLGLLLMSIFVLGLVKGGWQPSSFNNLSLLLKTSGQFFLILFALVAPYSLVLLTIKACYVKLVKK